MALPGLCCLCGGGDGASATLGPLLGPVVLNKLRDTALIHRLCALWSPEVGAWRGSASAQFGLTMIRARPSSHSAARAPDRASRPEATVHPLARAQVYQTDSGTLKCVVQAIRRGRLMK